MEVGSRVYGVITEDGRPGDISDLEADLIKAGFQVDPPIRDVLKGNKVSSSILTSKRYRIGFIAQRGEGPFYSLFVRGEVCCLDDSSKDKLIAFADSYNPVPQKVESAQSVA
jgi:hypothetical protein